MTTTIHDTVIVTGVVTLPVTSEKPNDWKLNMDKAIAEARQALSSVALTPLPPLDGIGLYGGDDLVRCIGGRQGDRGCQHVYGFKARFAVPLINQEDNDEGR